MKKSSLFLLLTSIIFLIAFDLLGDKMLSFNLANIGFLIINFRLPRLLIILLAGIAISISGLLVQTVSRNSLADSGMLGLTSGASFGVVLLLLISENLKIPSWISLSYPLAGICGACLAYAILRLVRKSSRESSVSLILSGLAITAIFQSLITIIQLSVNSYDFQKLAVWLTGDVWLTDYKYISLLALALFFALLFLPFIFNELDVLSLGVELSKGLGLDVKKANNRIFILILIFTSIGVAAVGSLGFVGLIAPHIASRLGNFKAKNRLLATSLVGMIIMLMSDIIAKNIIAPSTLPLGFVVALVGAPYFIFLIHKEV